jgi:hypothetical protein
MFNKSSQQSLELQRFSAEKFLIAKPQAALQQSILKTTKGEQ